MTWPVLSGFDIGFWNSQIRTIRGVKQLGKPVAMSTQTWGLEISWNHEEIPLLMSKQC